MRKETRNQIKNLKNKARSKGKHRVRLQGPGSLPGPDSKPVSAALDYAKRGWPVIPIHYIKKNGKCSCGKDCKSPGKHPIWELAPHGFKNATKDRKTIKRWWRKRPFAGIGIATGSPSGLLVLDIDVKDEDGRLNLSGLEERLGPLPETLTSHTPSGGQHLYFRDPGGISISAGTIADAIDVRAEGGYIVAPPSSGAYQWANQPNPAELPPAWVQALRSAKATNKAYEAADIDAVARALEGLVDGSDLLIRERATDLMGYPFKELSVPHSGVFVTWHFLRSFMIPPLFFPNPTA